MTEEIFNHGFGWIPSPPDERDFHVDQMYEELGIAKPEVLALPASYTVPNPPPVINQGNTPRCVAYSLSALKSFQDFDDQSPRKYWDFNEPTFFTQIGGTNNGAIIRNGLNRLVAAGYPVVGNTSPASKHKIKAYYAVPKTKLAVQQAIVALGVLECGSPWYHSWCSYSYPTDVLPRPDYSVGGHAWIVIGYNATGVVVQNSWGKTYAKDGRVTMPWAYFLHAVGEVWKVQDQ